MNTEKLMKSYGIASLPETMSEAMAYIPFQPYAPELCSPVAGFENGTIFKSLNKPFYGSKCGVSDND